MSSNHTILFATDLSDGARDGYTYARALAEMLDAQLHALHVRESAESATDQAGMIPGMGDGAAIGNVITKTCEADAETPVSEQIIAYVEENGVDMIVLGARGQWGRRRPLLGHVAQAVVSEAPCSVLTSRGGVPTRGLRRVLAPVDFSEASADGLRAAIAIGDSMGAQVDVLHVIAPDTPSYAVFPSARPAPDVADEWEEVLGAFVAENCSAPIPPRTFVRVGHPATTILNFALERAADLVVISAVGDGDQTEVQLGSVARSVSHSSICSTLTVRGHSARIAASQRQARLSSQSEPPRPVHHRYGEASLARRLRKLT